MPYLRPKVGFHAPDVFFLEMRRLVMNKVKMKFCRVKDILELINSMELIMAIALIFMSLCTYHLRA